MTLRTLFTTLHPIKARLNTIPVINYLTLLRTYIHVEQLYYLDMPFVRGRVRIANLQTGEYVIYGNLAGGAESNDVGADESLYMNVPYGGLRIKTAQGFVPLTTNKDVESLGVMLNWGMRAYYNEGALTYEFDKVQESDIRQMREIQYKKLTALSK